MRKKDTYKYAIIALIIIIASACTPRVVGDAISAAADQGDRYIYNKLKITKGGKRALVQTERSYCYRSLGYVDCFPEPVYGQERRLVGFYEPVVEAPESGAQDCSGCPATASDNSGQEIQVQEVKPLTTN